MAMLEAYLSACKASEGGERPREDLAAALGDDAVFRLSAMSLRHAQTPHRISHGHCHCHCRSARQHAAVATLAAPIAPAHGRCIHLRGGSAVVRTLF